MLRESLSTRVIFVGLSAPSSSSPRASSRGWDGGMSAMGSMGSSSLMRTGESEAEGGYSLDRAEFVGDLPDDPRPVSERWGDLLVMQDEVNVLGALYDLENGAADAEVAKVAAKAARVAAREAAKVAREAEQEEGGGGSAAPDASRQEKEGKEDESRMVMGGKRGVQIAGDGDPASSAESPRAAGKVGRRDDALVMLQGKAVFLGDIAGLGRVLLLAVRHATVCQQRTDLLLDGAHHLWGCVTSCALVVVCLYPADISCARHHWHRAARGDVW